jgi:glycosyltransferase involved in cell wall biosynthesis
VTPWCTILVPTYNGATYLPALLKSLAPAVDAGCALLFLDDCSTDESFEIGASCGYRDRSVLRNTRNIGLFPTLNRGLSVVTSDYVLLIFQDDIMNAEYMRYMKPLAEGVPEASFLWAGTDDIDENGAVIRQGLDTGRVEMIQPGSRPWRDVLYKGTVWTISGSLSKTERLRHYGFRPDLPHLGDYDFLLRAIRQDRFAYLEKPLIQVRIHRGQASFRHGRQSIDLTESVSVYKEQRTRFPEEFDVATRCRILGRTGYRIARRSAGQAVRGQPCRAMATLGLLPKLASALLP